jgi:hypothetical protein
MDDKRTSQPSGCWQIASATGALLWVCLVPIVAATLAHTAIPGSSADPIRAIVAISATAAMVMPPLLVGVFLTRRRDGWKAIAALLASCAAITGFLLLDAGMNAAFPVLAGPSLQGEGAVAAAARLVALLAYAVLAAWLVPHLAGVPHRPLATWLGLDRLDPATVLLALAISILVSILWPVSGALGDSLTSLSLVLQTLAYIVPQVLVVWGIVFCLLTSTLASTWLAALLVIILYIPSTYGSILSAPNWNVLLDAIGLVPLALLLTEFRARRSGVYALMPVAVWYTAAPLLFVDPRDTLSGGIPETLHILSHSVALIVIVVTGPVLLVLRWLLRAARARVGVPAWASLLLAALLFVGACGTWIGLYIAQGKPGFYDDGFLIILEEQADLSGAYEIADRDARLQYVYDALVETADRGQAPLREELDRMGVPYRPYYIMNMIRVDGHRWLASWFERKEGVARVILNPNVREYPNRTPQPYMNADPQIGVQSNLAAIRADDAWKLGVNGEGIVIAGQDTGYDWTHPALKPHYRGWDGHSADHDYDWHDAWDNVAVPFDDDSHGTHTMGIAVGDDQDGNGIGVAPGAQWIGCRNMRRGFGNPGSYAECMEYFLAPYPHGGDPFIDGDVRMSPHIISNSWGCPDFEGCFADTLAPAAEALRAAGIMMVVSAGNDGPGCGTAVEPPASYDAVFSVGATDDRAHIAPFSSRGPAGALVKPDISAPGIGVRSSIPGGDYGVAGGTSMAAPHVAGVAALLWSADPSLIGDIDTTERLMCQTAVPQPVDNLCTIQDEAPEGDIASLFTGPICACGDVTGTPNNVYGCGFIDAGAAVETATGK